MENEDDPTTAGEGDPTPDPTRGRITRVTGSNTVDGGRGLPKVAEIEMRHDDGRVVAATLRAFQGAQEGTAHLVRVIDSARFQRCPICLGAPGTTKEHVPPKPIGGEVMTYTCKPCNGGLGSRTESALADWFDDAFRIYYTREGERAPFGHDRVLFRQTESGEFVLLHQKSTARSSDAMREHFVPEAKIISHQAWPHPSQYMTGLLKNAYLAACLALRGVPIVDSAEEIRAELLAARDAASRAEVRLGPRARSLRVYRTGAVASGPALALVRTGEPSEIPMDRAATSVSDASADRTPSAMDEPTYLLSLAGTLLVSWPFPEISPVLQFTDDTDTYRETEPSG